MTYRAPRTRLTLHGRPDAAQLLALVVGTNYFYHMREAKDRGREPT